MLSDLGPSRPVLTEAYISSQNRVGLPGSTAQIGSQSYLTGPL